MHEMLGMKRVDGSRNCKLLHKLCEDEEENGESCCRMSHNGWIVTQVDEWEVFWSFLGPNSNLFSSVKLERDVEGKEGSLP